MVGKSEFEFTDTGALDGFSFQVALEQPFLAVWDTGASYSVVEPRVVDAFNLDRIGFRDVMGIAGEIRSREVYIATLIFAREPAIQEEGDNLTSLHQTHVAMLEENGQLGGDIAILKGMDIIQRDDFAVSQDGQGGSWFSFKHPSRGVRIDFEGYH